MALDATALVAARGDTAALEARLAQARASARVAVVEAFTTYLVARAAADAAAQGLESAENAFRVAQVRLAAGDVIPGDVIAARAAVSDAAVALLRANAAVVVAFEGLAAVSGVGRGELGRMVGEVR